MSAKKKDSKTTSSAAPAKAKAKAKKSVDAKLFDRLLEEATRVREHAYAPYSKYKVGAALATGNGEIYAGCNVENASFPAGICAERGAIMKMVADGHRDPVAIVVVTRDGASPCGVCRQMLVEFARDMPVAIIALDDETGRVVSLADLLPNAFELKP
jgi:cytidine deaminase